MGRDGWYRRTSWSAKDEAEFRARNRRSRDDGGKAQYLRIQAETLKQTADPQLIEVALALFEETLDKYPNESLQLAAAASGAANCCWQLGRFLDAAERFRLALDHERRYPQALTNAVFDFARFAAEEGLSDEYDGLVEIMLTRDRGGIVFPAHAFIREGLQALNADRADRNSSAREHARAALEIAEVESNGLGRGKDRLGLVGPRVLEGRLGQELRRIVGTRGRATPPSSL